VYEHLPALFASDDEVAYFHKEFAAIDFAGPTRITSFPGYSWGNTPQKCERIVENL
jgi:hypothetical protein